MYDKLRNVKLLDLVYNPKPIFDHLRNYSIAGAFAIGAFLVYNKFPSEYALFYMLLALALLLLILNLLSGVIKLWQWFGMRDYPLSTRILLVSLYCFITIFICLATLEATVQD